MATRKAVNQGERKPAEKRGPVGALRFEATLGPAARAKALAAASMLDLDRLPDAQGQVRLLVSADDARRLLEQGFEVHLKAAVPVAPLAPSLVMSDAQAKTWLEQQLKGIPRQRSEGER
jgi:hypothetical protein